MKTPYKPPILLALRLGVVLLMATACGQNESEKAPTAPGTAQGLPSIEARRELQEILGGALRDAETLGAGAWKVGGFSVAPYPAPDGTTTKGPHVVLVRFGDQEVHYVPLDTDGDIADLIRRVTGNVPEGLATETSPAGRAFWRRKALPDKASTPGD